MTFNPKHLLETILELLPTGRAYIKAHIRGTKFHKVMRFLAACYRRRYLIDNAYYEGLFIAESGFALERMRRDLNLPNENMQDISGYEDERYAEIFAMKYLMRDNTALGVQKLWNAFGVRVRVWSKDPYTTVITRYTGLGDTYPLDFPIAFDLGTTLAKLQYLTLKMKPMHCTVEFETAPDEYTLSPYTDPAGEPEFHQFTIAGKPVKIRTYFNSADIDQIP